MSKFVTKEYTDIKARQLVEQLFIYDVGIMDAFENQLIGTTFLSEFDTIIRYIEHFANGNSVGARMVFLKNVKDGVSEYEFRTKHLRLYVIQQPSKKILIFGGIKRKADSSDNIGSFRLIKKQYLDSLKK